MALSTRKRVILAKQEVTYGVDPTPAATDAMLVKNINYTPLEAELVSRDIIYPYYGNSAQLLATKSAKLEFEVELAGAGFTGKVPAYDALLKSCGFQRTAVTSAITITRTGSVSTATLTAHGYLVGDAVTISGATQPEYNGNFVITARTANTFDYTITGTPITPATGSPVLTRQLDYTPISSAIPSMAFYFNNDGILQKLLGCYGNVEFTLNAKQIPTMKFSFTGLYNALADVAAPSTDYSAFQIPFVANSLNTPVFNFYGYTACLESANLNMTNDIQYIAKIGCENVYFLDRKPAGQIVFEAPTITAKDFFAIALAGTQGALNLEHGPSAGKKVLINCPAVSIGNPNFTDSNGVQSLTIPWIANPLVGNDEIKISTK